MQEDIPYTEKNFDETYRKINDLITKSQPNIDIYVEVKQLMEKYVHIYISAEQREDFFSLFCEHDFMKLCQQIVKKFKSADLYILIIQNLNMILYNLKHEREIVFFLSRPELNQIILAKGIQKQSESLDIFIQFLKSITLRIKVENYWKIFINNKYPIFPILWQSIKYYNASDKLIRTTVRSIILEITKIKSLTIDTYLNNFPFLIFLAYECCFAFDQFTQIIKHYEDQMNLEIYIDDLLDQITFIQQLSKQLNQSTRILLYNGFLYYFVRPLWEQLTNIQSQIKYSCIYNVTILFLLNHLKDQVLKRIIYEIFFQKYHSKEFQQFLTTRYRFLKSYSFEFKERILEKCLAMIQIHCEKCYRYTDVDRYQLNQSIIRNSELEDTKKGLTQNNIKKSVNISLLSRIPYINNLSWQKWLNDELFNLSHGLGTNIERNIPIKSSYVQNLYYEFTLIPEQEKKSQYFKKTINLAHAKLQRFMENNKKSFYVKILTYRQILLNPENKFLYKLLIRNFLEELSTALYILQSNKYIKNIKIMIQVIELINNLNSQPNLLDHLSKQQKVKLVKQINHISQNQSKISESNIFSNGWNGYIQVFQQQQRLRVLFNKELIYKQNKIKIKEILIQQQENKEQDQRNIYFYYMIRRIVHLMSRSKNQNSFFAIFQNLKINHIQKKQDYYQQLEQLKSILFKIDDNKYNLLIEFENFQIRDIDTGQIYLKSHLKNLLLIKDMQSQHSLKLQINTEKSIQLIFETEQIKNSWLQIAEKYRKQIHELEIEAMIEVIESMEEI